MEIRCIICNQLINSDRIVLTNGNEVHENCAKNLENNISNLESTKIRITLNIQEMLKEINHCAHNVTVFSNSGTLVSSILDSTLGYVGKKEAERRGNIILLNEKIEQLKLLLHQEEVKVESSKRSIQIKIDSVRKVLSQIYDFWPTYPPYWETRRSRIIERDGKCSRCNFKIVLKNGKRRNYYDRRKMDVHHIKQIQHGGNHLEGNLVLLCEGCHQKTHGFEFNNRDFDNPIVPKNRVKFADKVAMVNEAIAKNRFLRFKYTNREGESTIRTLRPENVRFDNIKGKTLTVEGFCYLEQVRRFVKIPA